MSAAWGLMGKSLEQWGLMLRSDSSLEQGCGVGVRMLPVGSGVLPAQGFRLRFR